MLFRSVVMQVDLIHPHYVDLQVAFAHLLNSFRKDFISFSGCHVVLPQIVGAYSGQDAGKYDVVLVFLCHFLSVVQQIVQLPVLCYQLFLIAIDSFVEHFCVGFVYQA